MADRGLHADQQARLAAETNALRQHQVRFAHLFDSHAARDRSIVPWLVAALLHLPAIYLFFTSGTALHPAEPIVPILTEQDRPPLLIEPGPLVATQRSPSMERGTEGARQAFRVPSVTAILPIPEAVTSETEAHIRGIVPRTADRAGVGAVTEHFLTLPAVDPRVLPPRLNSSEPGVARASTLAGRIKAFNDSIAALDSAQKRARDWTVTDSDGTRWGASPGALHVAGVTIPLAYTSNPGKMADLIVAPPGRRAEANARVQRWNEIEVQATRADTRAGFAERVKQIRARRDSTRTKPIAGRPWK